MLASFSEFKFYQSFRIPIEKVDDVRFLCSKFDRSGKTEGYIDDATLVDISITGLGFSTSERLSVGQELGISVQFKKINLELNGRVVRAFTSVERGNDIIYGVEIDEDEAKDVRKFLEQFINSFSPERLKNCLTNSALRERYASATEGFEMLSLLLSLFRDITNFSEKENFVENLLDEVARILNAQRASLFLINPETNELEAIAALGVDKEVLKFDYRQGIAGSVFTTGVALNIDVSHDMSRFDDNFDKLTGFKTRSIICNPIYNREDKTIGVIQVLNKRNEDRFTVEDEKTIKVMALVFSALFHNYNPISERSQIRRFSTPFDRKHVLIGKSAIASKIRSSIIKLKDIDSPVHIFGEPGVGKSLLAQIIHFEGNRGLNKFETLHCGGITQEEINKALFGDGEKESLLEICKGGTLLIHDVHLLDLETQARFMKVISERGIPGSKISLDVRIFTTSTADLNEWVTLGKFNKDLLDYLATAYLVIDPLRKRKNDIKLLVEYFLKVECKKQGLLLKNFTEQALNSFLEYDWPGNVAELRKCVERAVSLQS